MRLCAGQLLQCDRVIYLDADTFVRESLSDLYDIDLEDKVIAAVKDKVFSQILDGDQTHPSGVTKVNIPDYYRNVLGIKGAYFNAGVMLIDLKKWRESNVKDRCLDFLRKHMITLAVDQDALNFTLGDRTLLIGYEWNFIAEICDLSDLSTTPRIIHFAGLSKPWLPLGKPRLFQPEYWQFAMATPYGDKLVDQFFALASSEEARIKSMAALIPSHLHPIKTGWAKHVPSILLKPLAESLCTFGKGRIHRTGVALWNVLKLRQGSPKPF
jgi:lipopolysaccharide biosynthesis glycosyltransferase